MNSERIIKTIFWLLVITIPASYFLEFFAYMLGYNSHYSSGFGFPITYTFEVREGCVIYTVDNKIDYLLNRLFIWIFFILVFAVISIRKQRRS